MGFLDFSTREARAAVCYREVELNCRLAPDVYLGVADILDPSGKLCDHFVVMRRMPGDRRPTTLAAEGQPVADHLRHLADLVATMHQRSPRSAAADLAAAQKPSVPAGARTPKRSSPTRDEPSTRARSRSCTASPPDTSTVATPSSPNARPRPGVRRARGSPRRRHLLPRRRSPRPGLPRVRRSAQARRQSRRCCVPRDGPRPLGTARSGSVVLGHLPGTRR